MDVSDQKIKNKYCFAVIDDCSRYCLGLFDLNRVTTSVVTQILDKLARVHGYPREILTNNGERFFKTLANELSFCKCPDDFRMRYNHIRPHISLEKKSPASVYFAFSKLF